MIPLWGWPEELPSWTWPGAEGRTVTLRAYTEADRISVFVNGSQIAESNLTAADKKCSEVEIVYAPGDPEVIGFGSANPRAVGSYQATRAQTYQGRALAILRATGNAGVVKITAEAEGLVAAEITVDLG